MSLHGLTDKVIERIHEAEELRARVAELETENAKLVARQACDQVVVMRLADEIKSLTAENRRLAQALAVAKKGGE